MDGNLPRTMRTLFAITAIALAAHSAPALAPGSASAPTFYVSLAGDDTNPGTLTQPWRTIQKAMNAAVPGSTVHIMAGTYSERLSVNVSGTSNGFTTFQPYGYTGPGTGDSVVLDYASLGTVTDGIPFLRISNRSYVTIRGLTFQNFACSGGMQQGVRIDGSSAHVNFVDNKLLHNGPPEGVWGKDAFLSFYVWTPAHHVVIDGNEFGWIHSVNSEALTVYRASDVTITDNYFHDGDTITIDIFRGASRSVVRGNRIEYWGRKRSDRSFWYGVSSGNIYVTGGRSTLIERNVIADSGVGVEIQTEPTDGVTSDTTVRDNVIYRCDQGIQVGINPAYGTDPTRVQDVAVYNNTVYGCDYGAVLGYARNVVWKNNAFVGCTVRNGVYSYASGISGHSFDRNLFYGNAASVWYGVTHTNDVTLDPKFADAGTGDFTLQLASPAIDAGDPKTTVADAGALDCRGNPRVVNGRIDIGAYEAASRSGRKR